MRKTPARASKKKRLGVFVSYASEDKELAAIVEAKLKQTFVGWVDVFRDVRIQAGTDYSIDIDNSLDCADVLLVLLTDRMKVSHSYTGFEIGFFKRSVQSEKEIIPGINRILNTMHYIQGVKIEKEDVFRISDDVINPQKAATGQSSRSENPAYRLLKRIFDIVKKIAAEALTDDDIATINQNMADAADELYKHVVEYLQGRVSSETFPERKIIIRTDTRPDSGSDGAVLDSARVELVGKSFEVFGIAENMNREFTWSEFVNRMPKETAAKWTLGIRGLVSAVIDKAGENYMVVTGRGDKRAFRLFVSKIITYVSNKTEIHIYFIEIRTPSYGDEITSRLSKGIDVGLRFRFLILEKGSKFRPEYLGFPTNDFVRLKPLITEMLGQMDLILKDAKNADLEDPQLLKLIYGQDSNEKVQQMMDTWKVAFAKLTSTAHDVLACDIDQFDGKKADFIKALYSFCESTMAMNVDYTSGVMKALADIISGKLVPCSEVELTAARAA